MRAGGAFGVIGGAVHLARSGVLQHLAKTGQTDRLIAPGPKFRPLQGAGALGLDLCNPDDDHSPRMFAVPVKLAAQPVICR